MPNAPCANPLNRTPARLRAGVTQNPYTERRPGAGAGVARDTLAGARGGGVGRQAASAVVGVPAVAAPGAGAARPYGAAAPPRIHDRRPADDRRTPGAAGGVRLHRWRRRA